MAASVVSKIRVVIQGRVHDLLDRVIDSNSPSAIRQYTRDLENALEELEESSAEAAGYVRTKTRERGETRARMDQLDKNIELIQGDENKENDHLALTMEVELMGLETAADELDEELIESEKVASQLNEAVSKLRARHAEMVQGLRRLEALDRASKAKEKAADAVQMASEVASSVDHVSVDNVAARLRARADVADVKFERAMNSIGDSVDNQVAIAAAAQRLAERQARRNAQKAEAPTPEPAEPATAS